MTPNAAREPAETRAARPRLVFPQPHAQRPRVPRPRLDTPGAEAAGESTCGPARRPVRPGRQHLLLLRGSRGRLFPGGPGRIGRAGTDPSGPGRGPLRLPGGGRRPRRGVRADEVPGVSRPLHLRGRLALPLVGHRRPPGALEKALASTSDGIGFLDLTPRFRAEAAAGSLPYLTDDTHWSAEGHRAAAHELAEFLSRRRVGPADAMASRPAPVVAIDRSFEGIGHTRGGRPALRRLMNFAVVHFASETLATGDASVSMDGLGSRAGFPARTSRPGPSGASGDSHR